MMVPLPKTSVAIEPGQWFRWTSLMNRGTYLYLVVRVRGHLVDYMTVRPDGRTTGPHTDPVAMFDCAELLPAAPVQNPEEENDG